MIVPQLVPQLQIGRAASDFLEILKHRIYHFESLVNLLANLGTSQDDLAADEDQEHNLGLDHAVNKTREQLRLVRTEIVMARSQTLQTDGKLDITGSDDVLNLEVGELGVETELLDNASILSRRQLGIIFGFGTSNNHLT